MIIYTPVLSPPVLSQMLPSYILNNILNPASAVPMHMGIL